MARKSKQSIEKAFQSFLDTIYQRDGLEGVANSLPFVSGPLAITRKGRIVAINDEFVTLLGYQRDELYGLTADTVTLPADREALQQRLKTRNTERYSLRLLTRDDQVKHVIVCPHLIKIGGARYRLAEFVDQTPLLALYEKRTDALQTIGQALAAACEQRDPYTFGHMHRTACIATEICEAMSLDEDLTKLIQIGASIHDIGKISVPIEILVKPARLEPHEWAFIKRHPEIGITILGDLEVHDEVKDIVLKHHEHQDGSGYPFGLKGREIPLTASVVHVADCLDAIAGARPYRKAYTFTEAMEIMTDTAHLFHDKVLAAARELVESGRMMGREFQTTLAMET